MGHPKPDGTFVSGMGNLFAIKHKKAKKVIPNIGIGNGLAWNDKENQFYFCDTETGKTYKYDYDATNQELCKLYRLLSNILIFLIYVAFSKKRNHFVGQSILELWPV